MAADSRQLNIILELQDRASAQLKTFSGKLESMKPTFQKMAVLGTAAFAGVSAAIGKTVKDATEFESIKVSFESMTNKIGVDSKKLIENLQDVSAGTVSSNDLMLSSNKAMALGVAQNMEEFSDLMEIARLKGRALGLDTTQAFNDIVTGIGRGSPLILDNLGITIKLGAAQEQYAKSLGKTVDQLTEVEKKEALKFAVLESGRKELEEAGELTLTYAEAQQQLKTQMKELSISIGKAFLPAISGIVEKITPVIQRIGDWAENNPKLVKTIGMVMAAIAGLVAVMGTIGLVLPSIITGFTLMASPIGLVVLAITAAVAIIIRFREQIGAFFEMINEKTGILDFFREKWQELTTTWQEQVVPALQAVREKLEPLKPIFDFIFKIIKKIAEIAIKMLIEQIKALMEIFTFLVNIGAKVFSFFTTLDDKIKKVVDRVKEAIDRVRELIDQMRELGIVKNIKNKVKNVVGKIKDVFVDDAVITPSGQVIKTNPADYLFATKTPQDLAAGRGGQVINININGGIFGSDAGEEIGDQIIERLGIVAKF